ncbi:MAG: hypothetical protein LUE29_09030 [Lachnospiraceae bacterium]|nr:hypothetical protein [Lachnospiraceae bacterium]
MRWTGNYRNRVVSKIWVSICEKRFSETMRVFEITGGKPGNGLLSGERKISMREWDNVICGMNEIDESEERRMRHE